jgi:hypothetical protein
VAVRFGASHLITVVRLGASEPIQCGDSLEQVKHCYSGQEDHAEQHGDRDEEHRGARRGLDQHLAIAEPYLARIDTQGVVEHRACHVEDQERQQTKCTGDRDVAGRLGPLSPPWPR